MELLRFDGWRWIRGGVRELEVDEGPVCEIREEKWKRRRLLPYAVLNIIMVVVI